MTRRDFVKIAATLRDTRPTNWSSPHKGMVGLAEVSAWRLTVRSFADMLELDNPFFDRRKWLDACGYDG